MGNREGTALRYSIFFSVISFFLLAIFLQLIRVQILDATKYQLKSKSNSVKEIPIVAPRGIFFDRNFKPLVSNKPTYTIDVIPAYFDTSTFRTFASILNFDEKTKKKIVKLKFSAYSKYKPLRVEKGLTFKEISTLEEFIDLIPGLEINLQPARDYSYGVKGSHIFGYLQEITAEELKKRKSDYVAGDLIGASGLERSYEKYLRGIKGKKFIVVDSKQRFIKYFNHGKNDIPPIKGNDLLLTIDKKTQQVAEKLLQGKKGAAVAIEIKTGGIIALASAPDFDLEKLFSASVSEWENLVTDPAKPMFNRVTMSLYPPGSTIKPLEALAGLSENFVTPNFKIVCKGGIYYGDRFFGCDHVHGKVNLVQSIEESCNTYYYLLFLKMGYPTWYKYMRLFGFGHKTGIDIYEEKSGLLPDSNYYNKRLGKRRWNNGTLLSLSIGQGELSVTPIQLAKYVALIANNGKLTVPHLVQGYIENKSNEVKFFDYDKIHLNFNKQKLKYVKEGMEKVVLSNEGTAHNIYDKKILIAGKTGTSQNPHGKNHALFIAYAPIDNPQIAVAVVVENAGYGSTHAAPVAYKIIKTFLSESKK